MLRGDYAYVADRDDVRVVSISTYSSPAIAYSVPSGDARDVAVAGGTLYIMDGRTVRVYDISDPDTPAHEGFLDVGETIHGMGVTGRIWPVGAGSLFSAPLQEGAKPTLISGSLTCTQVLNVGESQVDFVVRWRTEEWTDPSLLKANIWDWDLDEGCPTFGADPGTTFIYGDTGVETEIVPVIDGGYINSIRFSGGRCATVCEYLYKGRGWILDDGNLATITNTKSVKVEYCVQ